MIKKTLIFLLLSLILSQPACSQQTGWKQSMDEYLAFRNGLDRFSGSVAISLNGELIYSRSIGVADRTWDIPVNDSTKYDIASVTKMFTAIGIARLYEEGKIGLDDTIQDHFRDFPNKEIAQSTTIKELLSHTGGISDFFMQPEYLHADRYRLRSLEDYDRFYKTLEINESQAGNMQYSNSNFMILGRIIEKVSGQDYYSFIGQQIFEHLGMAYTGFYDHDIAVENVAVGYTGDTQAVTEFGIPNDGQLRENRYMRPAKGMPAGGAYSTTQDLLHFLNALSSGELIEPDTYTMFSRPDADGYMLGFQSYSTEGIPVIGHSGGFYGVSSQVFNLPEHGYSIVILSNADFGAPPVFERFISYLTGRKTYSPESLSTEKLSQYAGFYEIVQGEMKGKKLEISVKDDHLLFDNELEFYPHAEDSFFDIDNDMFTLQFNKDADGSILGFRWSDGRSFNAKARNIEELDMPAFSKIEVSNSDLEEYLGDYEFGQSGMMPGHRPDIAVDDGALLIDGRMRFVPYGEDIFYLQDDQQMQLQFMRNEVKKITGFHVKRGEDVLGRVSKLK